MITANNEDDGYTPKPEPVGVAAGATGSGLWVVACVLVKHTPTGLTFSQSVSWRKNATKNEATGAAVAFALESKPGYAIEMITAMQLDAPNTAIRHAAPDSSPLKP